MVICIHSHSLSMGGSMMEQNISPNNPSPSKKSFIIGFGFGLVTFAVTAFIFFLLAVFRRANVLNVPVVFDSDVAMATIIVPIMVAIPWLPLSILSGFLTWKMELRKALRYILPAMGVVCVALGVIFWNLPYN